MRLLSYRDDSGQDLSRHVPAGLESLLDGDWALQRWLTPGIRLGRLLPDGGVEVGPGRAPRPTAELTAAPAVR